jgi:gliding motility-associated-like protein
MRAKHTLYLSFFLSVLLLTATQNVFGQAGNAQITANDPRHETLNQREVSVLFDQTILSATTAGWAVTVNAIPVTVNSVLVVGNRVNITFDATPAHAAQNFLIPGDVLRVSYDQATGNTLTATAGNPEVNSFGLSISKNRWIGNCTDLAFFQIGDYAAPDICSPVNNNFRQFQYFLSLRLRNSAVFNYASQMRYQINWGDASALQNVAPYLSDNAGTANAAFYTTVPGFPASVTTSRVTHAFPDNTNVCSFNVRIFPYIDGVLNCNIGSLLQTSTFISYDMDDQNTGILSLIPSVANSHRVCQGNNANMRFSDATTLNCVPDVPNIGAPNIQARWIRIVYGYQNAPGPGNIPNIVVNGPLTGGAQNITNGAGVISPAAGYFPTGAGGIGVPDFNGVIELNTPVNVSTATTFMQTITTSSAAGQLVGQRFYVRLEYWNTCNPYNPGDLSNRVATDNYIEIVAKPTNPVATNKEYCFTETFASGGTCGAPTGEFFELTAGSVAGSTEIKWYNTLGDATADASAIASTYGANCRFLRPENRAGGTAAMAAAGVYSVFARYRTGAAAPNNCLSDPIQVSITRRSALSVPGVISPLTSDVCDGSTNVPYSLASASPVVAFGGATEYSWSFSGGAGATVDAPGTAQNITADFSVGGAFTTTTRSLDVVTQFATNATTGGRCPVGTSSRTVTIYGPTLGGTASGGTTYCEGTDAANISLAGQRGTILRWEVNFNGGGFVDAGVGAVTTFDPGVLVVGTYDYRAVVANGPCAQQNSTTTTIIISASPTPALVGANQNLCFVAAPLISNPLGGSNPAPGTGLWTKVSGPGTVTFNPNANTPNATATVSLNGIYVLRWTVTNAPCTSQADITVDYGTAPPVSNAGTDQDVCSATRATTLDGNDPTFATGTWTQVSGPGTTSFTPNANTRNATATATLFGTYVYRWRLTSGTCTPSDNEVQVIFRTPPTITGPAAFSACVDSPPTAAFNIALTGVRGGTFGGGASNAHWEVVTGGGTFASSTTAIGSNDASNPVEDTYRPVAADYTAGTVTLRLVTDDPTGQCSAVNFPVTITIDRLPAAADAGAATMSVCGTTAALSATAVNLALTPGALGTWTSSAGGVTFTPNANTANATANGLPLGTTRLTWTITTATGVCGPSSDFIDVTRNATPANNTQPLAKCVDIPFGTTAVVTLAELQALNDAITGIAGSTNRTVQFFTDVARTIPYPASSPLANGAIVYTIVTRTDVTPQCTTNGQVNITVAQRPLAIPQNPEFCEDLPVGSNTKAGINLTTFNNAIKNNVAANTVAWFTDAARTIPVATPASVTANNGTRFYARVTNPTTTCTDTTNLRVRLNPIPSPNPLLGASDVCADPTAAILYQLTVSNPGYTYTWSVPEPPFDIRLGGTSTDDLILLSFPVVVSPGQNISVTETSDKGCVGQPNIKNITVDTSPPAITIVGPSAVCENDAGVIYEVANLANTTYSWTVPTGASIISGQGTFRISVNFGIIPGLVTVTPTTTSGCAGNPDDHAVAINPRPSLDALSNSVCSDNVAGITLSGTGATSFDIISVTVQAGLNPSSRATANGVPPGAIFNDVFTNATGGPLVVQYTIVPVSALGCKGDSRVVNLLVQPEPVLDPTLADEICSSVEDVNITLRVATGSFAADQYEITSVNAAPGLTPVAGNPTNTGIFTASVLLDDRWENLTAGPLVVEYFVRPRNSGTGCVGDPAIPVRVTVNPEPQVAAASETICSGDSPTLTLTTSPLIAGSTFAWTVKTITGLISGATNGTGATITDILVNNDVNPGSVTYEVRATGSAGVGACLGPPTDVTITVNPAPLTNNVDQIVCSTSPGGNTFTENLVALQPSINIDGSLTFTWHTSFADADAGVNAMTVAAASAFPLANGIPAFVRVDNGICARIQAVTYTVHPTPSFTAAITSNYNGAQLSCNTSSNGIITVTPPVNGTAPYLYSIDGGSSFFTSITFNGLSAAGNPYVVRVRDARGCIADAPPLNFIAPLALTATTAITSNFNGQHIECRGDNNGEVTVARVPGTGTGAVTYSIQEVPGNLTGAATGVFTGLTAGTYTFVVRDVNNCQFTTASVTLIDPPAIVATAVLTTPVSCNGQSDGVITVTASGGTLVGPTYTYTISPGGTSNTTGVFSGLAANTYTVNVEDDNGCIRTSNSISVTQPSALTAFASVTSNYNGAKISCPGANDAVITAIANGGNGGFTYVLVESPLNITGNATGIYTGVGPGTYTVSVTDAQSCNVVTVPVNITDPTPLNASGVVSSVISCNGGSDGEIRISSTGGTGAYTFTMTSPAGPSNATGIFSGLPQGTYDFQVRDLNNCTDVVQVILGQPIAVTASALTQTPYNGSQISCNGASDGIINVTASGGTGALTYVFDQFPANLTGMTTGVFTGVPPGVGYTFTVRDSKGCPQPTGFVTAPVDVVQPPVIAAAAAVTSNYNGQHITCPTATDGIITVTASGGTGALIYRLDQAPLNLTGAVSGVFTGVGAGSYTVTVRDANSCFRVTVPVAVTPPPAVNASAAVTSNYNGRQITCNGASDGILTVTAGGGVTPYSYILNEIPANVTGAATGIFTGLPAGTYTVNVRDLNNCPVVTLPVTISEPTVVSGTSNVTSNYNGQQIRCVGASDGIIRVTGSGGTAPYTFISIEVPGNVTGAATGIFTGLPAGSYTFTVRDVNNCTFLTPAVVISPPTPLTASALVTSNYHGSQISCFGADDGTITVTAIGGTGALNYVFVEDPGNTTGATSGVFIGIGAGGPYTFLVTDANTCNVTTVGVSISEPAVIAASAAITSNFNGQHISCPTSTDGVITVTAAGGTGVYTYRLDQSPLNTTGNATGIYSNVGAGTYTVTVRDENGCFIVTTSVTVVPPPPVTATAAVTSNYNGQQISCNGVSDGILTVTAGGGVGSYTYLLNQIPANVTGAATGVFTGLPAGTYTVNVRDGNNCLVTTTPITITQPAVLGATAAVTSNYNGQQITCNGASDGIITVTVSGGTGPFAYTSVEVPGNITGASSGIFTGLPVGNYTFNITDVNSCGTTSASITISEPALMVATLAVTPLPGLNGRHVSCAGASDGVITVTVTVPGTGASTFTIDQIPLNASGRFSGVFTGIPPGFYTVTVRDANNCTIVTNSVTVDPTPPIIANAAVTKNVNCFAESNGIITVTASGGTGSLEYLLIQDASNLTGQFSGVFTGLRAGNYTVRVTDDNTCFVTTASVTVTQPANLTITIVKMSPYNGFDLSCSGASDGEIRVTATAGGAGPYTYALDGFPGNVTGATSGIFTGLSAGLYTVTVTDNNTGDPFGPCTRQSLPVFINNPIPLAVNLVGFNKQICIGDDPTTITQIANPVGGIGIYTYQWQDSIVGGVYTNIAGALSATFDPPAITQTTYYRRLLSSGSCATLASDPVEIKVNPLPEITNVTAPAFLCENSAMIVFYDFAPGQAPFFFSYTQETIDQSGAVIATKIVTDEISGDSKPVIQSPFVDDVRITVTGLRDFNGCVANPALFPPHQRYVEVLKNSAAFTATAATQCTGSAFTVQWNANPEVQYTFKWTEGPDAVFGPGLTGPQSDSRILNSFNTTGIQSLPIILTATNTLHLSNPLAPDCGVATHLENITIFPTIIPNIVVIEDKLCSGNAVQVTNSTSGGDFHTWTITRTNDGQVEPGFPITDNSALSKSFVINNTTAFNPATYEIRYDISNDPALGNGNCTNSATVTFDVYTEVVAKIGSPKDPAQTIQRWGESDAGDAGVMGVDGSGNFMRIDFENASTPVPPAAGIEYTWVFSNNNANTPPQTFNNINANPFFYNYRNPGIGKRANLTVTNLAAIGNVPGGCSDTDQFIFEIEIPPIVADFRVSRSMICLSDTITVTNLSTPLFNVWSIVNESTGGIPMTSNAFEPIFSLTEAGRYRISLKVRNPDFPDEDAFYTHATDQFVDAYDKPDASFITSPFPNVFVPDQELKTDNRSQTAFDPITDTFWPISYEWDFGDGRVEVSGNNPSISDPNSFHSPVHQYKTESQYIIYLTAYNDHPIDNPIIRCSSRDSVIINARAGGTTKVPNAFTPNPGGPTGGIVDDNGTTINDVFLPITKGVQEFKMQIFDRWGNLIFESNNRNQGWDGYDRNGNLVPAGVYVYKLVLRMSNDQRTTQVGDVTLIR